MEKQITLKLDERKARILLDSLHSQMHQLDELYEKNKEPGTEQSANVIEEIYEDLRAQVLS